MTFYVLVSYSFKHDLNGFGLKKEKRVLLLVNFLFPNLPLRFHKGIFVCVVAEMLTYDL